MGLKLQHDLNVVRNDKLKNILHNQEKNAVRITTTPSTNNGVHITSNSVYEPTSNHAAHTTNTLSMNTSTTGSETINPHDVHKKDRITRSPKKNTTSPDQEETVINLSTVQLSDSEIKVLSRGLSFVPTPKRINWTEVQVDINKFARSLRLTDTFTKQMTLLPPPPLTMNFRVSM